MTGLLLVLAFLLGADPAPRWPGFLGAGASPVAADSVPLTWSPTENMAWKAALPGYGQSSPVIWGDRVFVTTVDGPNKETLHVVCLSLNSGDILWDRSIPSTNQEKSSVYISRAAPTPVVDGQRVYAYFEGGDVLAFTHAGEPAWNRSLTKDNGKPANKFGVSGSPVQDAERVYILVDDEGPAYLVALNKGSGEVAWKVDRTSRKSWSSPALLTLGGEPQIVCSSGGTVDGFNPRDGKLLWSFTEVGGNTATTPLPSAGGFLVAAAPGREGENTEKAKESNGLMVVEKSGEQWTARFAWKTAEATPSWASPVSYGGHTYWVNRTGAIYCFNEQSGEKRYTQRIPQSAWATPIGIGDRLYVFGKDGATTVLATGPEFRILATNELWSADAPPVNRTPAAAEDTAQRQQASAMFSKPTVYGAAIVDGHIIIRTGSQVFCLRQ